MSQRTYLKAIAMLALAAAMAGCGSNKSTPEASATSYIKATCNGDVEKSLDHWDPKVVKASKEKMLMLLRLEAEQCKRNGGFGSLEFLKKTETAGILRLGTMLTFTNGKKMQSNLKMALINGDWLMTE